MAEIDGMFISFPSDYTEEERELILSAFQMSNIETLEKKGFGEFIDLMMASPGIVVVTFVSSVIATGIFRKLGGDIYDVFKKKLSEGFSKRVKAKARFSIELCNAEINVEFDVKNTDQLDFVFKNIIELNRKYEMDCLTLEFQMVNYRMTENNCWEKIQPNQSDQAPGETQYKGDFRSQNYRNLYVFPPDEADYEQQYNLFLQEAVTNNPYHTAVIDINNKEEFKKMLELRQNVYIDELNWITEEDKFYDNGDAIYIVVYDEWKRQAGSLRILKPNSPWMIEKECKILLDGYPINKIPSSIEITRLFISTEERHLLGSMQASVRLFQALYHWMTAEKFDTIYMVVRPEYMRFFRLERFHPETIGKRVDGFDGVVGKIDLDITMPYLRENRNDLWQWLTQKNEL